MVLDTHQCHFWLLWTRDKHWHHDELSFHAEPWWKIVQTKSHRPSALTTAHLTKRIHAIHTQTEPYVSRIQIKFRVRSIYFSPLRPISGVSQHRVFLAFLFVPSHQLSIIFIFKQTLQTWYYRRIPHDLRRNSSGEAPPRHLQDHLF